MTSCLIFVTQQTFMNVLHTYHAKYVVDKVVLGQNIIQVFTLLLYIAVNTTIIEYNIIATCFNLQ